MSKECTQHGADVVSYYKSISPLAQPIPVFLLIYQCTDGQVMLHGQVRGNKRRLLLVQI